MLTPTSHANAHCIMKILKGSLKETRYSWPTIELNNGELRPLQVDKETLYAENEVTYMSDKLGLHKISNPDPDDFAVSLHCTCITSRFENEGMLTYDSVHTSECVGLWLPYL